MNTQPELIQREATLLADLRKLIDERIAAEKQMHAGFRSRTESAEREYAEGRQRVDALEQQDRSRIETEYADARQRTTSRFESEHGPLEAEYHSLRAGDRPAVRKEHGGCPHGVRGGRVAECLRVGGEQEGIGRRLRPVAAGRAGARSNGSAPCGKRAGNCSNNIVRATCARR